MPSAKKNVVTYTVEAIDVDGDGIPDGDLVTKFVNGKVVLRKFVPHEKMKEIADNAAAQQPSTPKAGRQKRLIYKNVPATAPDPQRNGPVMVADQTGFAQYIKMGAATQAGSLATNAVVDGIAGLFSGGEE